MTTETIVRALRDPEYRNTLSETERAALPDHPAGWIELEDAELKDAAGGRIPLTQVRTLCDLSTWPFC